MKKLFYIFTLSLLLINLSSCYLDRTMTTQKEYMKCMKKEKGTLKTDERNKVYQVITFQGDTINFNKKIAGKITSDGVIGLPQVHLLYESADSIVFNEKSLQSIWKNNIEYGFIEQDQTGYICHVTDTVFIPFFKIEKLKARTYNKHLIATSIVFPVTITSIIILSHFGGAPIGY